ncbi:dCTP deaminase [Amycolatopsis thermoflava]|uniref:dCTP deaminase n=1 Tax=Amycolatopsis thermoflava TaxID=84480 RepID=UPI0037F92CE8
MTGQPGVLTDVELIAEAEKGILISENFQKKNVQQTCYELRAGNTYYDISNGAKRNDLRSADDYILVKPHQMIVVITKEGLNLPADIVGRILMKGKLFSLGLQPVNTYADPGFSGRLGIVIYNTSPKYIKIEPGTAIAKIEFERLAMPVSRPYSGQHGYQTEIWPLSTHLILSPEEVKSDKRVDSVGIEMRRAYGEDFGAIVDRVFRYERRLLLSVLAYMLFSVALIVVTQASDSRLSTLVAFLIGLVTNIASSVLIWVATSLRWTRK